MRSFRQNILLPSFVFLEVDMASGLRMFDSFLRWAQKHWDSQVFSTMIFEELAQTCRA
jgi:hypothetical protein